MIATAMYMYALSTAVRMHSEGDNEVEMSAWPLYLSLLLDAWAFYWVGKGLGGVF